MMQTPDLTPGHYYVSARDAGRTALLAGPFVNDHAGALAMVDRAREAACEINGFAWFWAFGTVRVAQSHAVPGKLNAKLGLPT